MNTELNNREYWRSLADRVNAPETQDVRQQEFPGYDPDSMARPSRRSIVKLMGASMALAGLTLTGCRRWPEEQLAPYSAAPKDRVPGKPEHYATALEIAGVASPLLVRSLDGRPIKIEGHPAHPASKTVNAGIGAASAFAQASILDLYDPQRSRGPYLNGSPGRNASWDEFLAAATPRLTGKVAVLTEALSGPTFQRLRGAVAEIYPGIRWFEYEPVDRDNEREGLKLAFGQPLRPVLKLAGAKVIASFDDDLLGTHPNHIRHASDFAQGRTSIDAVRSPWMSRLYVCESMLSTTGTMADHRLPVAPASVVTLLNALAAELDIAGFERTGFAGDVGQFLKKLADDLKRAGKRGVVCAGSNLPAAAHAVAAAINAKLASEAVAYIADPAGARPTHAAALAELTAALKAGEVQTLLVLGGNPVYDAPADVDFAAALARAEFSAHLSLYRNETSLKCTWHLNRAHYLECWSDARSWDGTITLGQPLIEPLFGGKSPAELLAALARDTHSGRDLLRQTLAGVLSALGDSDKAFRKVIHDGFVEGSTSPAFPAALAQVGPAALPEASAMVLRLVPDYHTHDGRFANNAWLAEMPDPITTLTWDNAACISTVDAEKLNATTGSVLKLTVGDRSMTAAAYVLPGQPVGVVTLSLGYGHTATDTEIARGVGFDAYRVRTGAGLHQAAVAVTNTGETYELALAQGHHLIDDVGAKGRDYRVGKENGSGYLIRESTLEEYLHHPQRMHAVAHAPIKLQLFDQPHPLNDPHRWGMAIDMTACIGCNACVIACQAENNVPVVGKTQVIKHREMHWIRIDRYFKGAVENPSVVYQPMMCVQCENAPCEQVCPVAATVHDSEGLNTMVYNRCIGTRYCSNNCPYKVRRFNYYDWHAKPPRHDEGVTWLGWPDSQQKHQVDPIKKMVYNPQVTVRMRGVMEKCTYCVQRIKAAQTARRIAGQTIRDGDVVVACQQSCPTQAITFGDLNDPNARVSQLHQLQRGYKALDELNVRPRTAWLGRIRNPVDEHGHDHHDHGAHG